MQVMLLFAEVLTHSYLKTSLTSIQDKITKIKKQELFSYLLPASPVSSHALGGWHTCSETETWRQLDFMKICASLAYYFKCMALGPADISS